MLVLFGHIVMHGMSPDQLAVLREAMVAALCDPAFYPHPTHTIQVIHTHISTIFLTGEFAYKIKKPVNFGFLDFSSLAQRRQYCEAEVQLNRRFAPQLYLGVMAIVYVGNTFQLVAADSEPSGEIIDYAVQMRQFDPADQLDQRLAAGQLTPQTMDALAIQLANIHQQAEIAAQNAEFGSPASVFAPALQNVTALRQALTQPALLAQVNALDTWLQQAYAGLQPDFQQRKQAGYIRACHGDLHLGNIALIDGKITFFDGIEFNEALRWIDTASDVAFLLMDLAERGYPHFARRLLNQWLAASGDYAALAVLRFYLVYRAMVRAKVQALRLAQLEDATAQVQIVRHCAAYLTLAQRYTHIAPPALLITHGLSGSGKSYGCQALVEQLGLIQLRADVERKRLAGMRATQRERGSIEQGIYSSAMTAATYQRLAELASDALRYGWSVVVDATFLQAEQRQRFRELAAQCHAAFLIVAFQASPEQLAANIQQRQQRDDDASDADMAVLQQQLSLYKPLQDAEPYVTVHYGEPLPLARLQALLGFSER